MSPKADEGEAPNRPIGVADDGAIEAYIARLRCACGTPLRPPDAGNRTDARVGDQMVRVVRAACESCGEVRRVYFTLLQG
jgi:hypothetical protein